MRAAEAAGSPCGPRNAFRSVASEFGIGRARVGQIVRAEEERKKRGTVSGNLEFEALRLRHRHALELAPHVDEEERFALFVAIVGPSRAVAEASRAAALAQLAGATVRRPRRRSGCAGGGVDPA